jgi:transglutaminase-like putative cysteine protease
VQVRDAQTRYQVTLEPHNQRWLYALDIPGALPQVEGNATSITYDVQIATTTPISTRIRYDAVSHLDYDLHLNESPQALRRWLELPPGFNPGTLEFASRLRAQSGSGVNTVNAALRFFREQDFRYTLEPPLLGRHAVDEFLFSTRAGFCEHYSSAFVVMMRAAGIPARVVVGYQGGTINPADNFMEVRQSDAHAWAEVWLENRGWTRVDPTEAVAPNRIEQNLSNVIPRTMLGGLINLDASTSPWIAGFAKLRQQWDALNNGWNQWVLNYTPERQKKFVEWLGFDNVDWRTMIALMVMLAIVAVAIVVIPLILQQTKRDPLVAVYESLCNRMAKKGLPKLPHEGPRAYCERLTSATSPLPPEQKAALARFLKLYETVRYSVNDETPASALPKLKSLLAECR